MSAIATPLPPTFNRLAWSNLAAQSAEQIALAAAPIVAVLMLGVGEGQTGLLQTALTLPFILFAIPAGLLADRISRRALMAGSEALRAAALLGILALIWFNLLTLAAAGAARLYRGMRNGRLQRGGAGAGAIAGAAAIATIRQCADRTGAHGCFCQRPGIGRRAGRMGRRRTGVWIRSHAFHHRSCSAFRHLRARARAGAGAASAAGDQGRRGFRVSTSAAAAGICDAVHLQHRVVPRARGVRALRDQASRIVGLGCRHCSWRCMASAWWSARSRRRG